MGKRNKDRDRATITVDDGEGFLVIRTRRPYSSTVCLRRAVTKESVMEPGVGCKTPNPELGTQNLEPAAGGYVNLDCTPQKR